MAKRKQAARARPRYRVLCYELSATGESVIMDATGEGFIAAAGTIADGSLRGRASLPAPDPAKSNSTSR